MGKQHKYDVKSTAEDFSRVWNQFPKTLWATSNAQPGGTRDEMGELVEATCGPTHGESHPQKCLDWFHMTEACKSGSCHAAGAHTSRYVNRMKAQMFLNM